MEKQIQPKPIPPSPPEEKKVDRKTELVAKKAKNHDRLPPAEEKELAEILAAEAVLERRGALIYKLRERAEKVARKEETRLRRKITDNVAKFGAERTEKVKSTMNTCRAVMKDIERVTESAIQELRETFNRNKKMLEEERDRELAEINKHYTDLFTQAELELETVASENQQHVSEFKMLLEGLPLEQLEELEKGKAVKISEGGTPEYIALANPDLS